MSERETRWNGQPTKCERVIVRVGEVINPNWWCASLAGQERRAVAVHYFPEGPMFLDNDDGQGWHKVTAGGGPEWGHKTLPDKSEVLRPDDATHCPCGAPYDDSLREPAP